MLRTTCCAGLALAACLAPSFAVVAQTRATAVPTSTASANATRPVSVAAFKNGLAFVVRKGSFPLRDGGWATIDPVPDATFGALWIASDRAGTSVDEIVARWRDATQTRPATSVAEMLAANAGKIATIRVGEQTYAGVIVSGGAPVVRGPDEEDDGDDGIDYRAVPGQTELLLIRVDGKMMAFNRGAVSSVQFADDPSTTLALPERKRAIDFHVTNANSPAADVSVGYLRRGIGWTPSYRVTIASATRANVAMQATLVNDGEDLENTDVFFAVGVPNFAFSHVPSPLALKQSLSQFMASLAGQNPRSYGALSNSINITTQQVSSYGGDDDAGYAPDTSAAMTGASEGDLFLYERPRVTLARGARGTYNVFSADVDYEDIYEWEVGERTLVDAYGNTSSLSSAVRSSSSELIWHSLRLANSTAFPWTTAPAIVVSGSQAISQDTLGYTPKGAKNTLRLTVATDVQASESEVEVARKTDAVTKYGNQYDQVTIEGTLKIKNFKKEAVKLAVRRTVTGASMAASDQGAATRLAEALNSINPTTRLSWDLPLAAGEEKTIKYSYTVLVRS